MSEMVDPLGARIERGSEIGFIYFVQVGGTGSIKIGWAVTQRNGWRHYKPPKEVN